MTPSSTYTACMAVTVDIREARAHLGELLEQVAQGDRVTISRAGAPLAELVLPAGRDDDWASTGPAFSLLCYGDGAALS